MGEVKALKFDVVDSDSISYIPRNRTGSKYDELLKSIEDLSQGEALAIDAPREDRDDADAMKAFRTRITQSVRNLSKKRDIDTKFSIRSTQNGVAIMLKRAKK